MKITVLSLFPSIVESFFKASLMKRAVERGIVSYSLLDIRSFSQDKHKRCDDEPYGGGAGMVMLGEPIARAIESLGEARGKVIFASPSGRPFTQEKAQLLAQEESLVFICGRYEGIDQRILDLYVDEELSIGDYVISSGEVASLVLIDSIYRLLEGVIKEVSLEEESFTNGLLEYPHYTRPRVFRNLAVPEVLLSGDHAKIASWRFQKALEKTRKNRPDLWSLYQDNNKGEKI